MANPLSSTLKSIWHTFTSYDRHSSFDSPYRSGRHVPLGHDGLTSVATASESRADITSPYPDYNNRSSLMHLNGGTSYNGAPVSPALPQSPTSGRAYSPGMRSHLARTGTNDGFEMQSPVGEIPMQSFQDGMPPAPPVTHSWSRIDAWAEENYPELWDQLCEGCTVNDINELEHQLDCSLPADVRDSLQVHDGQERGGMPTGIIFGSMLLDCEEMVQEWDQWRKVNQQFLLDSAVVSPSAPGKALGSTSEPSSSKAAAAGPDTPNTPHDAAWREKLVARQESIPPNSIRKAYAHNGWIPLVRDWGGNNLAVDLAPGPKGHWGQIILFGRDYDTKYVVARSWAHFMALVADDLNSGKWFIDEDTQELKLREFKSTRVEPGYFDILRWRMDQKFGRRAAKRRSAPPGTNGVASPPVPGSPYSSASEPAGESRGRTLHRLSGSSPLASPMRPGYGKASPLARVTEENTLQELTIPNGKGKAEKLVEVDTPRPSGEENSAPRLAALTKGETPESPESDSSSSKVNGKQPIATEEAMKEIEI